MLTNFYYCPQTLTYIDKKYKNYLEKDILHFYIKFKKLSKLFVTLFFTSKTFFIVIFEFYSIINQFMYSYSEFHEEICNFCSIFWFN